MVIRFSNPSDGQIRIDGNDNLSAEDIEKHKGRFVYAKSVETRTEYPVGIRFNDNPWVKQTKWYPDGCVVGIAVSTKNERLAAQFIRQLLN